MKTTLNDIQIINLPVVEDARGNLAFIQEGTIPYPLKRIYYLYDVPSGAERGGHAHIHQHEILIAISGSFDVILDDGTQKQTYSLNRANKGLHIVEGIWRELQNFSSGAICLVIADSVFEEADYIREYNDFVIFKNK